MVGAVGAGTFHHALYLTLCDNNILTFLLYYMLLPCHPSLYSNSEEISSFVILGQLILLRRRVRTTFQVTTLLTILYL